MTALDPEIERLIAAAISQGLEPRDRATLSRAVAGDQAVAAAMARACWIDEGLFRIHSAAPAADGASISARLRNAVRVPVDHRSRHRRPASRPVRRWWWVALLAAAILLGVLLWSAARPPLAAAAGVALVGRIEAESGAVHIDGGRPSRSAELQGTETIHSSGRALLMADGVRIACAGETRLRLASLTGPGGDSLIELAHGHLLCEVDGRRRAGAVVIRTPAAQVRVTGTSFQVSHGPIAGTVVQVAVGQVLVESAGRRYRLGAGDRFASRPDGDDTAQPAVVDQSADMPTSWRQVFSQAPDPETITGIWHSEDGGFLRGASGRTGVQPNGRIYPTRSVRIGQVEERGLRAGPRLRLQLRARVSHAMHCNVMLSLQDAAGAWQGNVMAYPQLTEVWQDIDLGWQDFTTLTTADGVTDLTGTTIGSVVVQIVGGKTGVEIDLASIAIQAR